jgi:hypothetical protein
MADFEHLIAGIGGLEAAMRNNQAKADANLKEMREEVLSKVETNQEMMEADQEKIDAKIDASQ